MYTLEKTKIKGDVKMAKKLSQMVSHNDVNGREIKCLIVNDGQGNIYKEYDRNLFDYLIDKYGDELIKVFVPTLEQRNELFTLIHENTKEANGKTVVSISDEDLFLAMFSQFTDLDVSDIVADKTLMRQVLDNPSQEFILIKSVLEQIMISITGTYQDIINVLASAPKEVVDNLMKQHELEEDMEKQKEIEELQARLKELQG